MFILIVAGSREYTDYEFVAAKLDIMLRNKTGIIIRQGECRNSPDMLAKRYAAERGYPCQSFPADWSQGNGAAWKRNYEMAKGNTTFPESAHGLAAFNAGTKGTGNMIEIAHKCGIPVREIKVVIPPKPVKEPRKYATAHGYTNDVDDLFETAPAAVNDIEKMIPDGKPKPRKARAVSQPIIIDGETLEVRPKAKRKKAPVDPGDSTWKIRYRAAHELNFRQEYAGAYRDGHYIEPTYPKVRESNGMQTAIVNYLNWMGHRAKRINNMGRRVEGIDITESGAKLAVKKWIPSAAGKGQADISATCWSKSTQLEVKAGRDKPSDYQLREQAKERKAGGIYEFIHSIEQFYELYDELADKYQGK